MDIGFFRFNQPQTEQRSSLLPVLILIVLLLILGGVGFLIALKLGLFAPCCEAAAVCCEFEFDFNLD